MQSQIDQIKAEIAKRELSRRSPLLFYKYLHWPLLEPGKKFIDNWAHDYLNDILMACAKRQLTRVSIQIQPRFGKSGLFSVSFPTWMWLTAPSLRFIQLSHSYSLSMKLAEERLTVLQSEAYHSIAPNGFALLSSRKKEILNSNRGYTCVLSAEKITGIGADFILLDDFMSANDAQSNVIRENANLTFENAIMSRLDDKVNGVIMNISQRLHPHDLAGYTKANDMGFEYFTIKTQETADITYHFPFSGKTLHRKEGDLLQPLREPLSYIEQLKKSKKLFETQYQQNPDASSGDIFNDEDFAHHTIVPQIEYRVLSIDTATTANVGTSSRWCFSLFGSEHKSLSKARKGTWALMDCYAKEMVYVTGRDVLAQFIEDNKVDLVIIEKKSSGQDLESDLPDYLKRRGFRVPKIAMVVPIRDKITRAYLAVPYCDLISIPTECNEPWFVEWKQEVLGFPNQYDDRPDTLTQFIRWLKFDEKDALTTHKTKLILE